MTQVPLLMMSGSLIPSKRGVKNYFSAFTLLENISIWLTLAWLSKWRATGALRNKA